MKATDRIVLIGIASAALVIAFFLLVLVPKRNEAGDLASKVAAEKEAVQVKEQQAAFAAQARQSFPSNYHRLVVLGKAVPADDDTSSLFVEVGSIAERSNVEFRTIELDPSAGSASAPPPPPAPAQKGNAAQEQNSNASQPAAATTPATPTESTAASLPIGATVGSAGLPVMPYKLTFRGDFFDVAKFISGVDRLVSPSGKHVTVRGRLMTIDGFSLTGDEKEGFPKLKASFVVTTYLTPATQGLTAGASPSGPGAAAGSGSTPVSNTGATP